MITAARVTGGYAAKLPALMDRKFSFKPGANIVFGPNGCGKSTLLGILAAYSAVPANGIESEMGWSRAPSGMSIGLRDSVKYPKALSGLTPGDSEAVVRWDGSPTMYQHTALADQRRAYIGETDGILDTSEELSVLMGHPSSGEQRLYRFKKLMAKLKSPPDLTQPADAKHGLSNMEKPFVQYISKLSRKGPSTILLDEPERSLSPELHEQFWGELVPMFSKKYQMIIATHSNHSFLLLGKANFIDMIEGKLLHAQVGILMLADIIRASIKAKEKT